MKTDLDELLSRGVSEFIDPEGKFKEKLINNPDKIVIKFGVDPTRPDIHLGHAVVLRKLRQLQDLGCKVIFLIGDLTAQIGDPTGRTKVRPEISIKEIEDNMETFKDQVGKILSTDTKVFDWITNSDWYIAPFDIFGQDIGEKLERYTSTRKQLSVTRKDNKQGIESVSLINFLSILRKITFAQLIERDMFQERIKEGRELYMHEMMYPVLQGIDSSAIAKIYGSCDLEVGGTDQTFNMLMGRNIMKVSQQDQQSVLVFKILPGLDGKEKMSKSLDNYIAITDEPTDMYGKVMSIPDSVIVEYLELCTDLATEEIKEIETQINNNEINPRDAKMCLAREIIKMYHSEDAASAAEEVFINTFQKKEIPADIEEITTEKNESGENEKLSDLLVRAGIIESKSEFRRLVEQGGVHNLTTESTITDQFTEAEAGTYKIGKRRFIKIV